ncbi:MAG: ATP-binding protein [Candidatus Margulisiibacteriota bacterium]
MLSAYAYTNLFSAALSIILAIFVLVKSRPLTQDKTFFVFMLLSISAWCFGIFGHALSIGYISAYSWSLYLHRFAFFIPVFYFIFVYFFINSKSLIFRVLIYINILILLLLEYLSFLYPSSIVSYVSSMSLFQFFPRAGILYSLYVWQFALSILIASVYLAFAIIGQKNNIVKQRNLYILISTLIGFPCAASTIIPMYNINIFPLGNFGTFLFVIVLVYSMMKHELMDIKLVITRAMAYGSVFFVIILSFIAINFIPFPDRLSIIANAITCFLWLFFADKLRSLIQTPLQEKWITGWYDSGKLLNRISQKLVPVVERTEVFDLISDELKSTIRISKIDVKKGESGQTYDDLAQTKEGLVIPLSSSSGLEALMILGPKISEDPYDDRDLTLFRILMNQAVLIFDRIKPYEQIKHEFGSTQKKLFETEKMLSRSARLASLGTLTAGVTHEIRNPLAVIRSSTEDISKVDQNKDSIKTFQTLVLKHVDRIAGIVDKMLYLSKSKAAVNKEIDINKFIEQYIVGLVSSKNTELLTQLNPVPNVLAIEDDLHQVLINLTSNAIKAMPNGGNLTIKTYETKENESRKVVIEVSDTGTGIQQENLEKIFDPFFSTWENGTGLGLSISYKIIEELKGRIEVQSQVGKGSTFKIILPAV